MGNEAVIRTIRLMMVWDKETKNNNWSKYNFAAHSTYKNTGVMRRG
jgi:hypothetical protein